MIILQAVEHLADTFILSSWSYIITMDGKVEVVYYYDLNLYEYHGRMITTEPVNNGLLVEN